MDFISYAVDEDELTREQVMNLRNHPAFENETVRLMPDAHGGAAGPVGFTSTFSDKIVPNIVGVDIACRVTSVKINADFVDFTCLDKVVHAIVPSGFNIQKRIPYLSKQFNYESLYCWPHIANHSRIVKSMGTLGSGNHYIAMNYNDKTGEYYLTIHCGSRNLGKQCAQFYQNLAVEKNNGVVPNQLAYIEGEDLEHYLNDMRIINKWSMLNHQTITENICQGMNWSLDGYITNIHNYIDVDNGITRKGAISAQIGEACLIPLNMRDGILVCKGKGNTEWNCSAPHGAGRIMSRTQAKKTLSMKEYQDTMSDVYTTCIVESTLDEAPMAYKNAEKIKTAVKDTVEIVEQLQEVYSFKAK